MNQGISPLFTMLYTQNAEEISPSAFCFISCNFYYTDVNDVDIIVEYI